MLTKISKEGAKGKESYWKAVRELCSYANTLDRDLHYQA